MTEAEDMKEAQHLKGAKPRREAHRSGTGLLQVEVINLLRGQFHWVLLITIVAIIITYYLLPATPALSNLARAAQVSAESGASSAFGLVYINPASLSPADPSLADPNLANPNLNPVNSNSAILEQGSRAASEGLRSALLPTMMAFEVVILGFLFIAVTVFQEKEEGVIRAYRVSPATTLGFCLNKVLLWTAISTIYGLILSLATANFGINYLQLAALLITASFFYSSLGLIIAVFFRNLSDWFIPGVGVLVVNMLPLLGLAVDSGNGSDSPLWMQMIPGFHSLSQFRMIFTQGQMGGGALGFLILALTCGIIAFGLSNLCVHFILMRERG